MADWQKIIMSGSHAELKSLRLDYTGSTIPNPNFHLNNLQLSNDTNWSGSSTSSWKNGISGVDQSPWTIGVPEQDDSPNTGPKYGVVGSIHDDTTEIQVTHASYLYTELSYLNSGDDFYLRSPKINLTDVTKARLVFYFHAFGAQMGRLQCRISSDPNNPPESGILSFDYINTAGQWEMNVTNIPGQMHYNETSAYNRAEIDLDEVEDGDKYIWIQYTGLGENPLGDFAIGNIYLTSETTIPPILDVDASSIDFTNLPTVDPQVPGRLYTNTTGYIFVSSG